MEVGQNQCEEFDNSLNFKPPSLICFSGKPKNSMNCDLARCYLVAYIR